MIIDPLMPKMASLHAEYDGFGCMAVRGKPGIRFLELRVKDPAAVARFYKNHFGCPIWSAAGGKHVAVCVGPSIHIVFSQGSPTVVEVSRAHGLHICIYIAQFKEIYLRMKKAGIIWTNPRFRYLDTCNSLDEAIASRQFRFKDIIIPGESILEFEHETRSMTHCQFMKVVHYVEAVPSPFDQDTTTKLSLHSVPATHSDLTAAPTIAESPASRKR